MMAEDAENDKGYNVTSNSKSSVFNWLQPLTPQQHPYAFSRMGKDKTLNPLAFQRVKRGKQPKPFIFTRIKTREKSSRASPVRDGNFVFSYLDEVYEV